MNEEYMIEALKQAKIAFRKGDVPVGAIIVKDSKIIARAYNKREEKKDVTYHAEILAIQKACKHIKDWRLSGCVMYITLEPCAMCMGAIKQSRIEKVIYGAVSKNEAETPLEVVRSDKLGEECTQLLKTFFQNVRN